MMTRIRMTTKSKNSDSENTQNLKSSQHHICGHGDLKVRCLERGQSCRRSANKFFSNSKISEEQFTKSEQSVADCAQKCRDDETCESFTYHHEIGTEFYSCILRKAVPSDIDAVYASVGKNAKSGFNCGEGMNSCFSGTRTCQPI